MFSKYLAVISIKEILFVFLLLVLLNPTAHIAAETCTSVSKLCVAFNISSEVTVLEILESKSVGYRIIYKAKVVESFKGNTLTNDKVLKISDSEFSVSLCDKHIDMTEGRQYLVYLFKHKNSLEVGGGKYFYPRSITEAWKEISELRQLKKRNVLKVIPCDKDEKN